jgi:hypothetical protein
MSRFVFVLGAGASAAGGAPVASNFMEKAKQLQRNADLGGKDKDAFDLVFRARDALKAVHSKANLDLANLEVLFNAFEMAALFNRLGPLSEEEVQRLPDAMRRVIARTIEENLIFHVDQRTTINARLLPPTPYGEFADLLIKLSGNRGWHDTCVITFNYDLGIDCALGSHGISYGYGLDDKASGGLNLLKLHGSLNWHQCPQCQEIVPWPLDDYLQKHQWKFLPGGSEAKLEVSLRVPQFGHCGPPLIVEPTIVPPTWNKGTHYAQLKRVWRLAAKHLSEAEYIFIIGYSYPPTDEFFKYLYALGSIGEGWLEHIYVFNPDDKVGRRIGELLGPLAKEKYNARTNRFDQAISVIEALNLS